MKQKVTPFLSVLLALSFLMPAALFAKPIETRAAQFYSTPNKVLVSNNFRYTSSTKTWAFGGDGNNNNPIGVNDITWGDQANCEMVNTIAFRSTTHKPVSAGDTLRLVSMYLFMIMIMLDIQCTFVYSMKMVSNLLSPVK